MNMRDQKAMSLEEFETRFRTLSIKFAGLNPNYHLIILTGGVFSSRGACALELLGFSHPCLPHPTNDETALRTAVEQRRAGDIIGSGGLAMALRQAEEVYEEVTEMEADFLRQKLAFADPTRPRGQLEHDKWHARSQERQQRHLVEAEDWIDEREARRPPST
jgi:hypothetical protein